MVDEWEDKVFLIEGRKLQGSGVLIEGQQILTAAHLSFKLNDTCTIRGTDDRIFQASCTFIAKDLDFAILKSSDLRSILTPVGHISRGSGFIVMVGLV